MHNTTLPKRFAFFFDFLTQKGTGKG
jgi:hypothetical protein